MPDMAPGLDDGWAEAEAVVTEAAFTISDRWRRIVCQYHRPIVGILGDLPSSCGSTSLFWLLSLVYLLPRLWWDLAPHSALEEDWEAEQAGVYDAPKVLTSALSWGAC